MENIIKIFRPYIDNQENLDFVHSEKFGWIQIDKNPYAETAVFAEDKTILLSLLARWFFDRAECVNPKNHSRDIAEQARKDAELYAVQLLEEDRTTFDVALSLLGKWDDVH